MKQTIRKAKKIYRNYKKARRLYITLTLVVATVAAFWPVIEKALNIMEKIAK